MFFRVLFSLSWCPAVAFGATWEVDAAGTGDFTGIQEALDAASDGDTVFVRDGSYTEGSVHANTSTNGSILWIERSVEIIGESVDGVQVFSDIPITNRTAALTATHYEECSSACTAVVRNLTFHFDDAGLTGGNFAYTIFKNFTGANVTFDVANVVVFQTEDHAKTILYSNSPQAVYRLTNLTVDFGNTNASILYKNTISGSSWIRNSVLFNANVSHVSIGNTQSGFGIAVDHTIVHGPGPASGTNSTADPLFVDYAGGDLRLSAGSPAIDAGNPDPLYNDLDGSRNDMGAYGGGPSPGPDSDGDGVLDVFDVCPAVADPDQQDTDGDGIGDACDIFPELVITGTCPGLLTFSFSGFTPGGSLELAAAESTGSFDLYGSHPCAGTPTGLSNDARVRAPLVADGAGDATFQRMFRQGPACDYQIRAIDLTTCETTPTVQSLTQ